MKVNQLIDEVRDNIIIRESTFSCWKKAAKPIGEFDVDSIDKSVVNMYWKTQMKPIGPVSPETVRRRLSLLAGIWNTALEEEIIEGRNPWLGASKKIRSNVTYSKFGKEYPVRPFSFYQGLENDPIFNAIWLHGFRIGEIAGLLPEDICFNNQIPYFKIRDNKVRLVKPGSTREVPIHPAYYSFVSQLKTDYSRHPGKNWSQKQLSERFDLPSGEAAHSLRHNFISRARDVLESDSMISKLVGHRPAGMTGRYGTWTLEAKYEAIKKIRF
tara:strand:+ start:1453 stop:2262 length:810 start_codon:yes stop_codon:yes gene_type:complete